MKTLPLLLLLLVLAVTEKKVSANSVCAELMSAVPNAHIIVVDDERSTRLVLSMLFERRTRINVKEFATSSETLAFLETTDLPIVGAIVDKKLGPEDGIQLAQEVLKKGIPVVVCTGNCGEEAKSLGLPFLSKPPGEAAMREIMENLASTYLKKLVEASIH